MKNWHSMPFVRLTIPFCLGIVLASFLPFVPASAVFVVSIAAFFTVLFLAIREQSFRLRGLFGIPPSIFFFSVGYTLTAWHDERGQASHFSSYLKEDNEITLVGIIEDKVEKEKNIRITLSIKQLCNASDSVITATGNLLLYLKKDSTQITTPPHYGDVVLVHTRVRAIEPPKNPDAIDFKQYWHFQNIHYQGFIQTEDVKIVAHGRGNWLITQAKAQNAAFVNVLRQYLSEDEFAVGSALILGSKEAVREEIRTAYIETGAMHILAISGMHILLIFSQLQKILDLYKTGNRRIRWVKTVVLIFFIALFALLTGLGSSIVRAAIMASFVAIGKTINRQGNTLNLIMASAFCLLFYNPFWLFDLGFQLSYSAVIGIALFAEPLKKAFVFKHKLFNWTWQNVAIGLAAQLAVTPLALYYFHQFPTYFWLSGLLVGLVADIALLTGVVLILLNGIPFLSGLVGKILFGVLWLMNQLIFSIQKLPFNLIEGVWISLLSVFLIYGIIYGVWVAIKTRKLRVMFYPLSIFFVLTLFYAFRSMKTGTTRQLIVYQIPRKSLVDILINKKCYAFFEKFSKNIDLENRIKFAAENHRNSLKINDLVTYNFNEYVKCNSFIYHSGYMALGGVKVALLDKLPQKPLLLQTDFVIIRNNPKLTIQELKQIFDFKQIIFDASNGKKRVEGWKKECTELGYNYHDVAEKGAWILNF